MSMHHQWQGRFWMALVGMLICLPWTTARCGDPSGGPGDEEAVQQRVKVIVSSGEDTPDDDQRQIKLSIDVDVVKPGKYWIGVICSRLDDDLLKTHLGVDNGMVITEVVQGSPAQKAGLQKDDILIKVDKQPLTDVKVLVDCTEKAQDNPLMLTLIRKGKRQELKVVPAQRPGKYSVSRMKLDQETIAEWKMLKETLRKHGAIPEPPGDDVAVPDASSLLLVMPAFVLPDQMDGLPKDLEVTITRKGQEKTKITVKRADKQWDVDAKSLDKLPEDIRPHVEKMLGQAGMNIRLGVERIDLPQGLPNDLHVAPQIIQKSLRIAPDKLYELHRFAPKLKKEMRVKIHQQLKEAHQAIEKVKTKLPTAALEKIENELKALRALLEQLQDDRDGEGA